MPQHEVLGRHTDPGSHGLVHLPLMILLAVVAECTLSDLADPENSALEGDIFLLEVCLQHMGTHLMIQLTGIIAGVALMGDPARGI